MWSWTEMWLKYTKAYSDAHYYTTVTKSSLNIKFNILVTAPQQYDGSCSCCYHKFYKSNTKTFKRVNMLIVRFPGNVVTMAMLPPSPPRYLDFEWSGEMESIRNVLKRMWKLHQKPFYQMVPLHEILESKQNCSNLPQLGTIKLTHTNLQRDL